MNKSVCWFTAGRMYAKKAIVDSEADNAACSIDVCRFLYLIILDVSMDFGTLRAYLLIKYHKNVDPIIIKLTCCHGMKLLRPDAELGMIEFEEEFMLIY